jgi:hypothetical protein
MSYLALSGSAENKRLRGQFFTTCNPFNVDVFHKWIKSIPNYSTVTFLEPFAGANNIVGMIGDIGYRNHWDCFDISPVNDDVNDSDISVVQRDTLLDYPTGYIAAITNPPYLAKNSATRRGLEFPVTELDDLYQVALGQMLANTPYVAAIIPESFITQGLFHNRLKAVVSLTCQMFDDTEVPVCLALFVPAEQNDFAIYVEHNLIGNYSKLKQTLRKASGPGLPWRFNVPTGSIGLQAIDNQKGDSIAFVLGDTISSDAIKESSRSITRIAGPIADCDLLKVIDQANKILAERRKVTQDVFMTSFKGLRIDGRYRRRLDFSQAREILNLAVELAGLV